MSNATRGEVDFEALGKRWTLKMGTRAIRWVESETGLPMGKINKRLSEDNDVTLGVQMFCAGLQQHHPGTTLDECDDIFDELGEERVARLIMDAFQKGNGGVDGRQRPRKATTSK